MNPLGQLGSPSRRPRSAFFVVALCAGLVVLAAACGSDAVDSGGADASADSLAQADGLQADAVDELAASTVAYADPGKPGPYPVGISTIVIPRGDGTNDVTAEVWYPAAEAGATFADYTLIDAIFVPSRGYRDVKPAAAAPFLLVVFSHGFGGVRWQNYSMAERLASFGYIVVAPDHPGTTILDVMNAGNLAQSLIHRPGTVIESADAIWHGAVADLHPRGATYAVIGHSLGALTTEALGGGVISPSQFAAECAKANPDAGCGIIGPMDVTPGDLAQVAPPDPRIQAMVIQNPAGTYAFVEGSLAHLPNALIMSGDRDDSFYHSGAEAAFAAAEAGTAFVTYLKGGHNGPTDICDIPAAKVVAPDCKGAEAGFAIQSEVREISIRHVVAWLGVHFGHQAAFAQDLTGGSGFTWQTK